MHTGTKKEQFSVAYVGALAARVGLNHAKPVVDEDSVDLVLIGKGYDAPIRNPELHIQLKCTSSPTIKDGILKFSLPVKNYNDLRGDNVQARNLASFADRLIGEGLSHVSLDKYAAHFHNRFQDQCRW